MKSITYISLLDWYLTKQRPQHIAENLSKDFKVSYLSLIPWKKRGVLGRHSKKDNVSQKNIKVNENLSITRRKVFPVILGETIKKINNHIFKRIISSDIKKNNSDFLWLTHPDQLDLIPDNFKGKIVYDCMDHYANFYEEINIKNQISKNEKRLVGRADIIFASSIGLKKRLEEMTKNNVHLVNNAVNFELFSKAIGYSNQSDSSFEIGYFGGIGSWFDDEALRKMVSEFPDVKFTLIGPESNDKVKEIAKDYNNVTLTGPKTYNELPSLMKKFDICIMPFKVNDLVKDVNPVKIYEYLSAGKNVIAPLYQETYQFKKYIYTYESNEELLEIIEKIKESDTHLLTPEIINKRVEFARQNTWEVRSQLIRDILKNNEVN